MTKKKKEDAPMNPTPRPGPAQRLKLGFGLNMIVMAVSFALYYLGFFGRVDGPLSMASIGRGLADAGFTVASFQAMLVAFFAIALTWNWVLNLIAHHSGQRMTCSKGSAQEGFCGELVQRKRDPSGKGWTFTCPHGHRRGEAHFHPIRKGKLANSILMASLAAAIMFHFA
jgi:hypothetical protein